ncbi:MAG: hypothetical protein ACYC77_07430 [Coriobacteriia bacterium]
MNCPNCGAGAEPGQPFCGVCGAQLPAEAAPTVPMAVTPPSDADDYAAKQAAYEAELAEYHRQQAAYDQQQATAAQPAYPAQPYAQAPYVQPAQPPKKKKTGLIIAIVVIAVLVLGGCIAGVVFGLRAYNEKSGGAGIPVTAPEAPVVTPVDPEAPATAGFPDAEAAALSVVDSGWVTKVVRDEGTTVTYWAGPPASEFVTEIIVEEVSDGNWVVVESYALGGGDVPAGDGASAAEQEAATVLADFLTAIQEDRADDAHALTVEPFSLDGASAQYSNGEFKSWEIVESEAQDDGSYWFHVTEQWYDNAAEDWAYYLVPTDGGYRISSLEPW